MKGLCEAIIAHKEVKVNMYEQLNDRLMYDPDFEMVSYRNGVYWMDGEVYFEDEDEPEFVGFDVAGREIFDTDDFIEYDGRFIKSDCDDCIDIELFLFGHPLDDSDEYWTKERQRLSIDDLLDEVINGGVKI